jgi:hypothetical protein
LLSALDHPDKELVPSVGTVVGEHRVDRGEPTRGLNGVDVA